MNIPQPHLLRLLMNLFTFRASYPKSSSHNLWLLVALLLQAALANLAPSASAQSLPSFTKLTSSAVVAEVGKGVSCAWADYDNDGYPDLLVLHYNQPNQLFHNNRDGTFTKIATGHLVTTSVSCTGASFGDYDGDGFLDLFITVEDGPSLIYHNDGGTNFTLVTNANAGTIIAASDGKACGAAWADYNRDGYLDLFVIRPNAGGTNTLYRNNGNGTFTAMAPGTGAPEAVIGVNNEVGFCSWMDVDNDGWPDLFIGGRDQSALYRNLGGTNFVKLPSSVFDRPAGRPVVGGSWADYDGDGLVDLVLGWDGGVSSLTLYRNLGGGNFTKVTAGDLGNSDSFNSTFPVWADANNDGFVDLFVGDAGGVNKFYRNNGDGTFTRLTTGLAINEAGGNSQAAVWADFNRDGWLDLFVNNSQNPKFLYQNNGGANAWLSVQCSRLAANTAAAIGARVRVQARIGGVLRWQTQQILGGDGRRSPQPLAAHFGLGDATTVETLVIEWPGGSGGSVTQTWSGLDVRQHLSFSQSAVTPPIIFAQPVSVVAASLPTNVVLTVSASGTPPLSYQWHSNGVLIAGANLASVTLPFSVPAPSQNYTVVITNVNGASTSSIAQITFPGLDSDRDGLPDIWEVQFGLNPSNSADALSFPVIGGVTNKLTYLQIYQFGLDPMKLDYDNDGVTDFDEIFLHGIDPKNPDTDGDGLPDGWEVLYGLNPRLNDANESKSFDGITNLQKYQWNLAHPNAWEQMYPNRAFSGTNTISDYERFTGIRTSRPVYDRNDRLAGVEYSSGVSLAYIYDGNGNLIRQKWLSRASETNGLPAIFSFLNNLTNNTAANGPYGDADGDGWSNVQEFQAGTNPKDATSKPDTASNAGTNIAALQLPFTPTNFVMGVGQLDGLGAEEIVIGADGNPGTNTNFILIVSQSFNGWATQRVDVGSFGVTSIAVGQPTNRPAPAIYLGLRQTGGSGRVVELSQSNGVWLMPTNPVTMSTNEAAFVFGVRGTNDLLANFATNGLDGALFSLTYSTNGWSHSVVSTNASHRGLGTHGPVSSRIMRDASIRLLDSAEIEVVGGDLELLISGMIIPSTAIFNPSTGKWYFQTPDLMNWNAAQSYFSSLGGNLVTISSSNENAWVQSTFRVDKWIGYYQDAPTFPVPPYPSGWASGSSSSYRNLHSTFGYWSLDADQRGILYFGALMLADPGDGKPQWYRGPKSEGHYAIGDFVGPSVYYTNRWRIPEPAVAANRISWRGLALSSGPQRPDQTNSGSIVYAFVDDKNLSASVDVGDDFVTVEYAISGNSVTTNSLIRIPITASTVAQSYGLVSVSFQPYQPKVLFTAEPDGQIFSWQALDGSGPLQRQLFTAAHQGKAWHTLAGLKLAEPGEGLIGLRVDPTNPSTCRVFLWPPQQTIAPPPLVSQTAPSVLIYPSTNASGPLAQVPVRLFDNEGNVSLPILQFQAPGSTIWSNATVLSVDGQTVGRVAALPTGSDHVLLWNAGRDLGAGFTNTVLLRVRASDVTLTGDFSASTPYRVEISTGNPVANPDSASTLPGVPVDIPVLANDTVENGRTLTLAAFTQPAAGLVSTNGDGTLRYTPTTTNFGQDSFTYTITDGLGGTSIGTVTVTLRAPGVLRLDAPQFLPGGMARIVMTSSDLGQRFELHYSTDLRTWTPLQTNSNLGGTLEFNHPIPEGTTRRFYRAVLVRP